MAQAGTDFILSVGTSQIVAPYNLIVQSVSGSLTTAGSTNTVITLQKNGSGTALAATLTSGQTVTSALATGSVSYAAGDVIAVSSALGTSAAGPILHLACIRGV